MNSLEESLKCNGQTRILEQLKKLSGEKRRNLEAQVSAVDWDEISRLVKEYVIQKPVTQIPAGLEPAPFFPMPPETAEQKDLYARAVAEGEKLLRTGKVAALTVAGGQGTRLGFDGPKGTYPITPVKHKTLFQYFSESLARAGEKFGHAVPWLIMTSKLNDSATRNFFAENNYFGLDKANIHFFTQGTMPAIAYDGQALLASEDSLALAPDGHGGTLLALRKSGLLAEMQKLGITCLSYFQVDNPLVPVVNPLFIGLHALEGSEMSCIMLPKTNAFEKLGNFCVADGKLQIIEYSDMPEDLATRTKADGTLAFLAGSPAIHVISLDFVDRLTASGKLDLPWHRADKKVAFMDETGSVVKPEKPNAVKLEAFIFDALQLAGKTMILEGVRSECFAPTKNQTGVDSAESCRAMLSARDARRMKLAGVQVPDDAIVELSPRDIFDDADALEFFRKNPADAPVSGSVTAYGR